jgi:hypothetical protein
MLGDMAAGVFLDDRVMYNRGRDVEDLPSLVAEQVALYRVRYAEPRGFI